VGTRERVRGCDREGRPFEALLPEAIADLDVPFSFDAVEHQLRELDTLARRTARAKPLIRSLLGTESLSSSQIMELAAGRDIVAGPETERRMLRFVQACHDGQRAAVLDRRLLLRVHQSLVPGGGTMRTGTSWAGSTTGSPADAVFVGPPAGALDELVDDLLAFLLREDLCPVVQAAIGYAQLEFVHPFRDGNGRVGRWLIQVVLRRRAVAQRLVPPAGLYFAANIEAFLTAHQAFRDGDERAWCTFVALALETCATSVAALLA
jgi:Fic family protein